MSDSGWIAHPTAEVSSEAQIGGGTRIWNNCQVREGSRIGEECVLSKDVYIDIGAVIGDRVKVQNGVSVYHGVTLEDDAFVGPHVAFTNDLHPRSANDDFEIIPTLLQQGASVGANATILCGITLGRWSMVAAGAVVTHSVEDHVLVAGNPAVPIGMVCECGGRVGGDQTRDDGSCRRCGRDVSSLVESRARMT